MFHIKLEIDNPDMSDMKKSNYVAHNQTRGIRQFPSLDRIHHQSKEISESDFLELKSLYPQLAVECQADSCFAGQYGVTVHGWKAEKEQQHVIVQYMPLLLKVNTPSGVKYFAGFEPDYD